MPGLEISVRIGNADEILRDLEANAFDLAVVALPAAGRSLEVEPFYEDELLAVAPKGSEMPEGGPDAAFLSDKALLLYEGGNTRNVIDGWFAQAGVRSRPAMEFGSVEAVKELVAAGLGWSVLPGLALQREAGEEPPVARKHRLDMVEMQHAGDRGLADMVEIAGLGHDRAAPAGGEQRGEQQVVLADPQRLVIGEMVAFEESAMEDRLHVAEIVCGAENPVGIDEGRQRQEWRCGEKVVREHARDPAVAMQHVEIVDRDDGALPFGRVDHAAKAVRPHRVVGIEHGDPAAAGGGKAGIARAAGALVAVERNEPHGRRAERGGGLARRIVRAVVGDDHLHRHALLRQRAADGALDGVGRVVGGDDDADVGFRHGAASSLP